MLKYVITLFYTSVIVTAAYAQTNLRSCVQVVKNESRDYDLFTNYEIKNTCPFGIRYRLETKDERGKLDQEVMLMANPEDGLLVASHFGYVPKITSVCAYGSEGCKSLDPD